MEDLFCLEYFAGVAAVVKGFRFGLIFLCFSHVSSPHYPHWDNRLCKVKWTWPRVLVRAVCVHDVLFKLVLGWFKWYWWILLDLRQAVDYEEDGCAHDLLNDIGFLFAIRQILRLKEGALCYWGLPCNSFGFMARSQHQRSIGQPFGSPHYAFVVAGNILAARMSVLCMLCIARGVRFMIEQPDRSAASVFPYIMHILSYAEVQPQRVFWWGPQGLICWNHFGGATMHTH